MLKAYLSMLKNLAFVLKKLLFIHICKHNLSTNRPFFTQLTVSQIFTIAHATLRYLRTELFCFEIPRSQSVNVLQKESKPEGLLSQCLHACTAACKTMRRMLFICFSQSTHGRCRERASGCRLLFPKGGGLPSARGGQRSQQVRGVSSCNVCAWRSG